MDRSDEMSHRSLRSKLEKLAHKDVSQLDDEPVDHPNLSELNLSTSSKQGVGEQESQAVDPNQKQS